MKKNKSNKSNRADKIMRNKRMRSYIIIGIIVAVAIGIALTVLTFRSEISQANASSQPIDGIQCGAMEQLAYHIHTHLSIFIDGNSYKVPSQIGITDKCYYWLHTHDETGVIHIESPLKKNFTLGQFFDIWHKNFNNTQILDNHVSDTNKLNMYINGSKVSNTTNYRDKVLHSHDVIAITYGKTPNNIPNRYEFAPGE